MSITLDGQAPNTYFVQPGENELIEIPVAGAYRMRVELFSASRIKSPVEAGVDTAGGKNGAGLPGLALADPMLLP